MFAIIHTCKSESRSQIFYARHRNYIMGACEDVVIGNKGSWLWHA